MNLLRSILGRIVAKVGPAIARYAGQPSSLFPEDFDEEAVEIIRAVRPFTMTSVSRLFALIEAVRYVIRAGIAGAIVECGVWRGGSMMAAALTLRRLGSEDRDLYLFDTYEGMSEPTAEDISWDGLIATEEFKRRKRSPGSSSWCYASIAEVRENLLSTGYNEVHLHVVKGRVEETIPREAPTEIAVLRLDTDWFESTRHALEHLYPRLSHGGVLIIDDYGYWRGCRKAVDEYFRTRQVAIFLHRIDHTGRVALKLE
ncbi:MAG: TylF/MycF/NovP-related O-methyltransferase [Kiritimatiellia bacterium]